MLKLVTMKTTIAASLRAHLYDCGLFEEEARAILDEFRNFRTSRSIQFDSDWDVHPDWFRPVAERRIRSAAISYLRRVEPTHYAIEALEAMTHPEGSA